MPTWEEVRDSKKAAKQAAYAKYNVDITGLIPETRKNVIGVPAECGKLTKEELEITETKASELLAKLASGTLSAVAVTTAFGKRALIADQVVNCLTEVFLDHALADAAELDAYLKTNGKPKGPLHGLPISLKDQFSIKGIDTCMGYSAWANKPAERDSSLVVALKQAGAVLYVRTNVPQSLMLGETTNPVFGLTTNPHNRYLTCGGSSGGEGALIAMKGSPLGVGTDIGGSIRIPAGFNGLYGIKPSYNRLPYGLAANSLLGEESVVSALGPISGDLKACEIFVKAVLEQEPWEHDPSCLRVPWNEIFAHPYEARKPVFGYFIGDGNLSKVTPSVERAVLDTVEKLRKKGYEVKEFEMLERNKSTEVLNAIFFADGGQDITRDVSANGDPFIPQIEGFTKIGRTFIGRGDGQGLTAFEFWQVNRQKDAIRQKWSDHWREQGVDALICPLAPYPSVLHNGMTYYSYTGQFNLLNYSAGVVPHSTVLPTDVYPADYAPTNADENVIKGIWDPAKWEGAPVVVQVVCRTLEEEKCLATMKIVDEAIRG